jgi:hypothetical protein
VEEVIDVVLVDVDESAWELELAMNVEVRVVSVDVLVVEDVVVGETKVSTDTKIRIATITAAATSRMGGGVAVDRLIEMTVTIDNIQATKISPIASGTV